MTLPEIDLAKTAYISIDLQDNILAAQTIGPTPSAQVLNVNNQIAEHLKNSPALIVPVTVNANDVHNLFPFPSGKRPPLMPNTARLMMPIATDQTAQNVLYITKHNPGAFFGTDLAVQLQRRGVDTIILGGVSSSNGVYATALDAYQFGYQVITVSDACADRDPANHEFFFQKIFPRVGWVTDSQTLLKEMTNKAF